MSDEIMSQEQTLEMLGNISLSTLYRMIDRGQIKPIEDSPVLKRRRSLRFHRSEINRVLGNPQQDEEAHLASQIPA